jgi:hypothetical protein
MMTNDAQTQQSELDQLQMYSLVLTKVMRIPLPMYQIIHSFGSAAAIVSSTHRHGDFHRFLMRPPMIFVE